MTVIAGKAVECAILHLKLHFPQQHGEQRACGSVNGTTAKSGEIRLRADIEGSGRYVVEGRCWLSEIKGAVECEIIGGQSLSMSKGRSGFTFVRRVR